MPRGGHPAILRSRWRRRFGVPGVRGALHEDNITCEEGSEAMIVFRRAWRACMRWNIAAMLAAAVLLPSGGHAADIPIEAFFRHSEFLSLAMSPDGRKVAALVPVEGRYNLAVLDLADRNKALVVTRERVRDVVAFWWINDHRLLFSLGDLVEEPGFQRDAGGLLAINADGSEFRVLSPTLGYQVREGAFVLRRASIFRILSTPENPTDDILVQANERNARYADVYRMNARTGAKTLLTFDSPGNVVRWVVDHDHAVRAAVSFDEKDGYTSWYRDAADAPWRKLNEFRRDRTGYSPVDFDGDNRTLLVASNVGRDKTAIYRLDVDKAALGEIVVGHEAVDVSSGLIYDRAKKMHVGITINADKPETYWFDAEWATAQKLADTALPGTFNTLARREGGRRYLVTSRSDTQPVFWSLLDLDARTLSPLASSREWIKPEQMSEMKPVRIKARDGLEIPMYLTIPRGSSGKNLPMVVHPHGGPWSRDSWGFDPQVQFLASRGYAVLQPNFRMSTGFGGRHFRAGFRQWGLAMQDDVTDATQWAISEGIADPKRICIFGASYGGYAALMGIIKTPELFRCAIDYVGVTNLQDLFTNRYWATSVLDYTLPVRLGDPVADKEMLARNSPVNLADRIDRPLLMAYGGLDINVLPEQGEAMRRALDRANRKYEWMYKQSEAHGYFALENRIEFYAKVEAFLKQHIGGGQ